MADLASIQQKIIAFRNEREWAQFHDLKGLAEAFCGEAGEVLENFLGKTSGQSRNLSAEDLAKIKHEIAEIFFFLTYLCNEYKIESLKDVDMKNGQKNIQNCNSRNDFQTEFNVGR